MCGIFGGIGVTNNDVQVALQQINRGDDGITVKQYGSVVLGHRRHLVKTSNKPNVEEGNSDQPYESDSGEIALVLNGEFFNFETFKDDLGKKVSFRTDGDTEVFLKMYELEGIHFLANRSMDAMFAMAIADHQKNCLYICRDWPGRLPLFYYHDKPSRTFLFSSQLSGLLTIQSVDLNKAVELTPGQVLTLDLNTFEVGSQNLYKPKPTKKDQSLFEIGDQLHQLLRLSAKNRTMGEAPICTMLSGGIDSLLTTYYVLSSLDFKRLSYQPTSYVFAVQGFDSPDVQNARVAAEGLKTIGLVHKEVYVTADELVDDIPAIITLFEGRRIKALSVYPLPIYYYLAPVMRKDGFKVTIGGHGVDEVLGAYDNWKELNKPHEVQCTSAARMAFINGIYDNMLRRASIIMMERGPIEARFPFLQPALSEYMLGIDQKWLSLTPQNAELMLSLIQSTANAYDKKQEKLQRICDYLSRYLDNNGAAGILEEDTTTELKKLFWKFPLIVAGMRASRESPFPLHLLFNAKLRGQHGSGISSLECKIVERYSSLGFTDIDVFRSIVKKAFHLTDENLDQTFRTHK